jgi:transcriptional regulator with XRE-family HTH domain
MQKELKKLKKKLDDLSVSQLASALGYRSPNTVANWLKNDTIPQTAIQRVRVFLKE